MEVVEVAEDDVAEEEAGAELVDEAEDEDEVC